MSDFGKIKSCYVRWSGDTTALCPLFKNAHIENPQLVHLKTYDYHSRIPEQQHNRLIQHFYFFSISKLTVPTFSFLLETAIYNLFTRHVTKYYNKDNSFIFRAYKDK